MNKGKKETRDKDRNSLRRPTAVDLLKHLWAPRDKKPPDVEPLLDIKTDIYSVPSTNRRIRPRARPLK